ncbi:MAG: BtpA/SgcQ family protein [Streptosporangiaceae bacterium]|jgi:predicted TIM-barrel enzyme
MTTLIGAESVALMANITPEFASSLGHRSIGERAHSAAFLGADAILISGPITGAPTDTAQLREAKHAIPRTPVLANTGVTADTVQEILAVADGAVVGTTLKRDAITWNPVDPARVAAFMAAAAHARESKVGA